MNVGSSRRVVAEVDAAAVCTGDPLQSAYAVAEIVVLEVHGATATGGRGRCDAFDEF